MKKLATTLVIILAVTLNGYSQDNDQKRPERERMTAEQRNQLRLKRMTLELDLSANQQKEMATVISEESVKREAKMAEMRKAKEAKKELTTDEKFALKNQMLDDQIARKAKMKKILNDQQFEKWEAHQEKKQHKMHKMGRSHKQKKNAKIE